MMRLVERVSFVTAAGHPATNEPNTMNNPPAALHPTRFGPMLALAAVLGATMALTAAAAERPLPRSTPEAEGVSSAAILRLVDSLDQKIDGMHSLMIVRHGQVIVEGWWKPYAPQHNHVLYSLSKSFTSTAVGCAVAEGRLTVDDEVLKFFSDAAPAEPSGNLKAMRVRDLLTMSTGHQDEPPVAPDKISVRSFLAQAVPHVPGTHFKYNTPATFMQSALVQKLTGQTALDYLRPRLFEPLGISQPVWDKNFEGISLGGYGLRVRTEDIAKFGQLYLQKGRWNGKQLLTATWVEQASARQVSNGSNPKSDWNQGYGFQFWRCRNNAFRGDGAFGQYCIVLPEQDAVVAITSGVKDMQAVLNVLWEQLLPAMAPKKLKADRSSQAQLAARLAGLSVKPALGANGSPQSERFLNRTFEFPGNDQKVESVQLLANADGAVTLSLRVDGRVAKIPCGHHQWREGRGPFAGGYLADFPNEPLAGTFGWTDDNVCQVKVCAFETPYHSTMNLKFDGDQVVLEAETNVGFGATKRPALTGRAK